MIEGEVRIRNSILDGVHAMPSPARTRVGLRVGNGTEAVGITILFRIVGALRPSGLPRELRHFFGSKLGTDPSRLG
jgi:hypothetical protein